MNREVKFKKKELKKSQFSIGHRIPLKTPLILLKIKSERGQCIRIRVLMKGDELMSIKEDLQISLLKTGKSMQMRALFSTAQFMIKFRSKQ